MEEFRSIWRASGVLQEGIYFVPRERRACAAQTLRFFRFATRRVTVLPNGTGLAGPFLQPLSGAMEPPC